MKKLRVGLVDLDTSHPAGWIPILRDMGHEIAGVFDGGTVYPAGYAAQFAEEHDIEQVYASPEEMAENVDLAIIHSCNWDLHVKRARPFVEADCSVLIDKPMVGNLRDADQLLEWQAKGHRVTGGSSLKFCREVKEFNEMDPEEKGEIQFVYAGCAVDAFNYGIHAYSLLHGLMGPGVESVKQLGTNRQHQIEIVWKDGRRGIVAVGETEGYLPFYATVVTTTGVHNIVVDSSQLYRALLETVLPYLAGEEDAPAQLEELLEVEKSAMAARVSWQNDGTRVFLTDLRADDNGYDGEAFGKKYRLSKL